MKKVRDINAAAALVADRAKASIMTAANPIPQLNPQNLARYIDGYERGYLREPALLFAAIETRDDRIVSVTEKRYKSVSRFGYDINIVEGKEEDELAQQHEDAIRICLENMTATRATKRDERGGFRTLVRQMCEAVGYGWAVHDLAWVPCRESYTLVATQMPLYWFEHTTGKLRYLESDYQMYGRDLEPGAWMVTTGRALHIATATAYLLKRMSLHDWVIYCGRVGPGIHAQSTAQKDSPDWTSLEEAVANFGIDLKMVTASGVEIKPIEMALKGTLPWPEMVNLMNMAIDVMWRGGNLSTQAGKDQAGVMIQGEEKDTLEQDDAAMCSDAINEYIVTPLIQMMFGTKPLAWVSVKTGARPDQKGMLEVDKGLMEMGFPFSAEDIATRYERQLPEEGEAVLMPRSVASAGSGQPPPAAPGGFPNEFDPGQTRDENGMWSGNGGGSVDRAAFEGATDPLRKKLKFGDEVAFVREGKAVRGRISAPDNGDGLEITDKDGTKHRVKKDVMRHPKNATKMRDFPNEKRPGPALSADAAKLIGDQLDLATGSLDDQARKLFGQFREQLLAEMEKAPTVEAALMALQNGINRIAGLVGEADLGKVDKAMETAMSIAVQDAAREISSEG